MNTAVLRHNTAVLSAKYFSTSGKVLEYSRHSTNVLPQNT